MAMVFKDYYKILGFETNKISIDDIKNAYREKAKKYHPDVNVGDSYSEEVFKDINEAYRILSNEKLRRRYDFSWYRYAGRKNKTKNKQRKSIKEMIISLLFGDSVKERKKDEEKSPVYGEDIVTRVGISIEEAFFGVNKTIKLKTTQGRDATFSFKIPAGVRNNDKIRMIGKGKKGKNGGKNGDLIVYINIQNSKRLKIIGNDLELTLKLEAWEAAKKKKKNIELLGESINVIIPEGTSSGEVFEIRGKGYINSDSSRGNLYVVTQIIIPKKLNNKEKSLYKELANIRNVTKM